MGGHSSQCQQTSECPMASPSIHKDVYGLRFGAVAQYTATILQASYSKLSGCQSSLFPPVDLAEQNLMSCTSRPPAAPCRGRRWPCSPAPAESSDIDPA